MKIAIYVEDGQVSGVYLKGAPADTEALVFEFNKSPEPGMNTKTVGHGNGRKLNLVTYGVDVNDMSETYVDLIDLFA